MELRAGTPIWRLTNGAPPDYAPLAGDAECEVVIIGGGITGALIGYELSKAGRACILIDKGAIGSGSTSASTALLSYELDTPLFQLARRIGEEDAAACYKVCRDSIASIEALVRDAGVDCELVRRKSLHVAEDESDVAALELEYALRRKHGIDIELLSRGEIAKHFSFTRPAALLTPEAAEIDVVKLVEGLVKASIKMGMRVYGRTQLEDYQSSACGCQLSTSAGFRIKARRIVFATGYESEKYLGQTVGTLKGTFAIATEPVADFPGWHERCLIWTTGDPYLYLRTTCDGRAIIGGEDVDFQDEQRRDALLPAKAAILESKFRGMFPSIACEIACAWTGTFGESKDSLAYIGEPPSRPGTYFALGYGGNGIAFSMVAAEIIRDACLGKSNAATRLFRFDR